MRHRTVLIAAAAVLFAGGVGYLAGRGGPLLSSGSGVTSAGADDDAHVVLTPDARGANAGATRVDRTAPLPEPGTPLPQIHDELVRRAAAGEARAACRLAAEHQRCEMERLNLRMLVIRNENNEAWASQHMQGQSEDAALHFAQMRAQAAQQIEDKRANVEQCDSAPTLAPEARARYWRQAALAGHVPSMRHYAIGNGFRWHDLMDALPALATYRREAEGIARRAAMHGDAASAYALAMAYADSDGGHWRPFLAQTVTPDVSQALAWFSVLSRHPDITSLPAGHPTAVVVARQLAALQAAATPAEATRAARQAQAVAIPDAGAGLTAQRMIRPDGGMDDLAPETCAESQFADAAPPRTTS
ncbi:hypothetical protein [Luteimonas terrae]|uniref:Sel1 repeat family protein n=1 Tax=Luteimonas terrae TaxID=1530191 RepID=A0ABU1XTL0_9GAMM|nr:hypothetical protein [Luteimonas terrae]MDR7192093.1 hypothetical protein [Luteimonas terrae]